MWCLYMSAMYLIEVICNWSIPRHVSHYTCSQYPQLCHLTHHITTCLSDAEMICIYMHHVDLNVHGTLLSNAWTAMKAALPIKWWTKAYRSRDTVSSSVLFGHSCTLIQCTCTYHTYVYMNYNRSSLGMRIGLTEQITRSGLAQSIVLAILSTPVAALIIRTY